MHFESEFAGHRKYRSPTCIRVRTERLPVHEGDFAMTKLMQMAERQFRSQVMIEDDVWHARERRMTRHHYCWQRKGGIEVRVDRKDAVYAARAQKIRVGRD